MRRQNFAGALFLILLLCFSSIISADSEYIFEEEVGESTSIFCSMYGHAWGGTYEYSNSYVDGCLVEEVYSASRCIACGEINSNLIDIITYSHDYHLLYFPYGGSAMVCLNCGDAWEIGYNSP